MLFSQDRVSNFINQNFEPAWETVRPVPMVRIDFGNGQVITRTLHGNIATYVCGASGQVVDILPGIYTPATYMKRLQQLRLLACYLDRMPAEQQASRLKAYHELAATRRAAPTTARDEREPAPRFDSAEEQANWNLLAEDTKVNETLRRRQIHDMLSASGPVNPPVVTKRLYKEVLHADLDDPYLGLASTLFATYPFKDRTPGS